MSYIIEDNIPIPKPRNGGGGNFIGPKSEWTRTLDAMAPGQSVLTDDYAEFKAADQFAMRHKGKRFAVRKIPSQGWRVWRVE